MSRIAYRARQYIREMWNKLIGKEDEYDGDPEDYTQEEIDRLLDWCEEQLDDIEQSNYEIQQLYARGRRNLSMVDYVSEYEYNDTMEDLKALRYCREQMEKIKERLEELIDDFS